MKVATQQRASIHQRREGSDSPAQALAADVERINQLEHHVQDRYLVSCDPNDPYHELASNFTFIAIYKMRLQAIALHGSRMSSSGSLPSPSISRARFADSLRILGRDNTLNSKSALTGFGWFIQLQFPWGALRNVVQGLCTSEIETICGSRDNLVRVWQTLDKLHAHHPELLQDPTACTRHLQSHVTDLTLRAWTNCLSRLPQQATQQPPDFIQALQTKWHASRANPTSFSTQMALPGVGQEFANWQGDLSGLPTPDINQTMLASDPFNALQRGYHSTDSDGRSQVSMTPPEWASLPSSESQYSIMLRPGYSPSGTSQSGWS